MATFRQVPYDEFVEYPVEEMKTRAAKFYAEVKRRRTIRDFSARPVPREIIENCLRAAATAPNGANFQPWHFAVAESQQVKREIRLAAEKEEKEFYGGRAPEEWLRALEPLGTDESKPFLETAPCLIAIFSESYIHREDGSKRTNYYEEPTTMYYANQLLEPTTMPRNRSASPAGYSSRPCTATGWPPSLTRPAP